uniref:Reverse transcriptase/retrotransposon-derived protein RNase H-like domain-containing protein n=1 Tax=Tanacetum cinerariifolium TaxID=118510 RepID=A0A6L2NDJ5_TANCI|nr:hypothetical protein [Tanacetum cinerariifolium]
MIHMPKGAKVFKDLLSHKEKLKKTASSVKLSKEYSAITQRSLPQKEGDPGSFTLTCLIGPLAVKNALADLGASINLMPHSIFRRLGISKLKPTKMSIQLADRSIKYPIGVCKNLLVEVSKFIFSVNLVVLEMDKNEMVPIILGWPFLATARVVIDVHEGKLSLKVKNETITFNIGSFMKSKHSRDDYLYCANNTAKLVQEQWVDIVNHDRKWTKEDEDEDSTKALAVSFYPRTEPVKPLEWKTLENQLKPSSVEPPRLELKELPEHLQFFGYFQIPITLEDQEKTTFTCLYGTFPYKRMLFGLCNVPATFQRCMTAIFHELIEDSMEVFMDDFSIFGSSLDQCLKNLEKMLKGCEETNLAPILIKPDWSLPFKIMCDTSDYAIGVVLGQRIDKHFKPIHYASKTMNEAQENYTTTEKELLVIVFAFNKFHAKPRLIQWILLLQEVDIKIRDNKGVENLAADHLSRLENPDLGKLTRAEIWDLFPKEQLMAISDKNNEPCGPSRGHHGIANRKKNFRSQVLLDTYLSRCAKLKSRWYGPFSVSKDMKNGAIELYDEEGSEFIVNKQRVKPYQNNLLDTNRDDDVTCEDQREAT